METSSLEKQCTTTCSNNTEDNFFTCTFPSQEFEKNEYKLKQEKIYHIPKHEYIERKIPVSKPTYIERIVEVPEIHYKEVIVEKIVEIPEIRNKIVVKEVEVPVNIEVPIIQSRQVPIEQKIQRNIPTPIDITSVQQYVMPQLKPRYKEIPVPIYVPRYIEVPVPAQFIPQEQQQQTRMVSHLSAAPPMHSFPQPVLMKSIQQKEPIVYNQTLLSQQQEQIQPSSFHLTPPSTTETPPHMNDTNESRKISQVSRQVSLQSQHQHLQQLTELPSRSTSGLNTNENIKGITNNSSNNINYTTTGTTTTPLIMA